MNSFLRFIYLVYFITHIPITLCIDLQALFGQYYPELLKGLYSWYLSTYNDILMKEVPLFLKSFIYAEIIIQLPFFFIATYAIYNKKNWIRYYLPISNIYVSISYIYLSIHYLFMI